MTDLDWLLWPDSDKCYHSNLFQNIWVDLYKRWSLLLRCCCFPKYPQWFQSYLLGFQLWQVNKTLALLWWKKNGLTPTSTKKCYSVAYFYAFQGVVINFFMTPQFQRPPSWCFWHLLSKPNATQLNSMQL